ncbi:hypothetical protein N7493_004800 [Penicillium malachiteum]|uniref:Mid2 domain-containing protein n=1 Tax=Penicillium malachiteum TaxID=1324776 RepID=A0AAD6HP99_9EURO|nr:hypothetical protein N7493_004800 [Penicillium malachiteum]
MARHGHRHSRVDRMISAKHYMEVIEDEEELGEGSADLSAPTIHTVGTIQNPLSPPASLSSNDLCTPSPNNTCLKDLTDITEDLLARRQAETTSAATVQTVVQVVDTNSQTIWQSSGTEFPMTVSNSAFGEITFSASSVSSLTNSTMATSTATLASTPSNNSTSTQSTATSKQRIPASSPRVFPVTGVQAFSTPLISVASTTTTSLSTSSPPYENFYYSSPTSTTFTFTYTGSSPSSSTNSYWSSTVQSSSSTNVYGGAVQTGTGSSSGNGDGSGSSTNSGSSGSGSSISPTTSKIVGGVVGSIAGLALLIFCVLYFLRRKGYLRNFMKGKGTQTLPSSDMGAAGSMETAEREGHSNPFNAAYLAPAFMKRWRQSTMTTATESTIDSGSSERGFQKISGRKIPPVLTHGGDGYGGGLGGESPTIPDCLIGMSPTTPTGGPLSSFTNHGPPPTSPFGSPLDTTYTREAEETLAPLRPSRVHLPVSSSVNFGIATTVNPSHHIAQPQSAMPLPRTDAVGRSHLDGSRGSRFTESL